jgi:hypothetical protein
VVQVGSAVEDDVLDARLDRPLGDELADCGGRGLVGPGLERRFQILLTDAAATVLPRAS